MSSKIKVDTIENVAGSGNVSLGSGHNLVVPGNQTVGGTFGVTGAATLSGGIANAGTITSGTIGSSVVMPTGSVIQTVATTDNTELAMSTGTTPTNYSQLNTAITPKYASSKILVTVHFGCLQYGGNDSNLGYGKIMFTSGGGSATDFPSSQLGANTLASGYKMHFGVNLETQTWDAYQPSMAILHAPNTTNALVYQVYFWAEGSSGIVKINKSYRDNAADYSSVATMSLMEIAG